MKLLFTLCFIIFNLICYGQADNYTDTLSASYLWKKYDDDKLKRSFHIYNESDTVFFKLKDLRLSLSGVNEYVDCIDIPATIEKGHNWCRVLKDTVPFSGYLKKRLIKEDSTVLVFSGTLKNGYIEKGSFIKFYHNGTVKQTGQYENNWKVGIWTSYYQNGKIEWIGKYIEEYDYPVVEFEYDENDRLDNFSDEESLMKRLIEQEKEK